MPGIYSRKHEARVIYVMRLQVISFVEAIVLRTRLWTVRTTVPLETDGKLAREGVLFWISWFVFE